MTPDTQKANPAYHGPSWRAERLQQVTAALAGALTPADLRRIILGVSETVLAASTGVVYLVGDRDELRLLGASGLPAELDLSGLPLDEPLPLLQAVRTRSPIFLGSPGAVQRAFPRLVEPTRLPASRIQALAALPLVHNDALLGGVVFTFVAPRHFDDEERDWYASFAAQCALAAERTRLYAAEQRGRADAETLLRVAASIGSAQLDLETIIQKVTDESTALVGAELGAFFYNVVDAGGESYQLVTLSGAPREAVECGLPRNTPIFAPTFSGEGVVRLDDVNKDPRYGTMAPHHGLPPGHPPVTSYLAAPVISRNGTVIGGLLFGHSQAGRFTEQHERLVKGLASIAAAGLDNALLFRTVREAEEKQRRLAEEMAETVRVNDLFTGVLAHDLRNPLAGIITAAQLTAARAKDEQLTKPLARVVSSAERMTRMVEQLLDLARVRFGQAMPISPRRADLAPIVRHVVDELKDTHRETVIVVEEAGDGAGTWDPDRLGQAFSNLVGNALQHGSGGQVIVRIDGTAADEVRVLVQNEGLIADALIPSLFDPFTGVHRPRRKGLGLGLFIAQEIARAHGGRLEVESRAPHTTFTLTIPRVAPEARPRPTGLPNRALVEAQERAWQSDQRMRLLVDSIRDYGIFMLDLQGRVSTWNKGAQRIKGYAAEEIVGKHLSVFYTQEEREAGRPDFLLARAATEGSVEDLGWRVRKDGSLFWADVIITALRDSRGELCGFAKITRDLSDRRKQDEQLRQSEEQIRLMVESVRDYAIFKLEPDGTVGSWNRGAERIKGYRADEIIGQHFSRFYPPEDVRAGKCEMELETAAEEGRFEDEGWRVRKDGSRFWANVIITPLRSAAGTLVGYTKVTRDLTERRKLEDERLRRAHVEEASRLREEFLAMVSHELKTPLAGMQLQLQALARRLDGGEDRFSVQLKRAVDSGKRLQSLVEMLLDVTRIVEGTFVLHPEPLDLTVLVSAVVAHYRDPSPRSHSQITLESQGPLQGHWDRARLEQLVSSLLSNALKFGAGDLISLRLTGEPDGVLIEVHDRGPGIPAEDREAVFERFSRLGSTRHHGGLGLGLYLVREIARAHGGQAEVRDSPEGGAHVTVRLPRDGRTAARKDGQ